MPREAGTWRQVNLVEKCVPQFLFIRHFATKSEQAESLAPTPPGGFTMKFMLKRSLIPFQDEVTVALFAVVFVVMMLVFLASVPLVNYLFP